MPSNKDPSPPVESDDSISVTLAYLFSPLETEIALLFAKASIFFREILLRNDGKYRVYGIWISARITRVVLRTQNDDAETRRNGNDLSIY